MTNFFFITIFLLSCGSIFCIACAAKIFHRFVFDGADGRSPYIISMALFVTVMLVAHIDYLINQNNFILIIFTTRFSALIVMYYLISSRLYNSTAYIKRETKLNLYSIFKATFIIFMFILIFNFGPIMSSIEVEKEFLKGIYIYKTNIFYSLKYLIYSFYIMEFLLLMWFDCAEKRQRYVKLNFFFLMPVAVELANTFTHNLYTPIILLLDITSLILPILVLYIETKSILIHCGRIDTRIKQITKIIRGLKRECLLHKGCTGACINKPEYCIFEDKKEYQIQQIANILMEDEELKEIILNKKFISRRHNIILNKIKNYIT